MGLAARQDKRLQHSDSSIKWSSLTNLWEMTLKIPWKEERRDKGKVVPGRKG